MTDCDAVHLSDQDMEAIQQRMIDQHNKMMEAVQDDFKQKNICVNDYVAQSFSFLVNNAVATFKFYKENGGNVKDQMQAFCGEIASRFGITIVFSEKPKKTKLH